VVYALTGVPGAGKSSAAEELERRGYHVIRFEELLDGAVVGYDEEAESRIVDVEKIELKGEPEIVVGHLAHELDVDAVIVLRADPSIIEERLRARGYSEQKVKENAEAEAIDVITIESLESGKKVYEIDGSVMSINEIADCVEEIIEGRGERFRPGAIDFSSYILERF